jgi:hypothetical protein
MNNKLNAMMDHVWDGFYTGQKREQRFVALVWGPRKAVYDITYTGSPPVTQRFELKAFNTQTGLTVRIAYPSA